MLIAGFESQIAARGVIGALVRSAGQAGTAVTGAALVRRDTENGLRVDRMPGFDLPQHVLSALDDFVDAPHGVAGLRAGQTALAVSFAGAEYAAVESLACSVELAKRGALWVTISAE